MAIQILPRTPGSGEIIGQALGTGLGSLLQGLAQGKVQQMHQKHEQSNLQKALSALAPQLGLTEQQTFELSRAPQQVLPQLLKQISEGAARQREAEAFKDVPDYLSPVQPSQSNLGTILSDLGQSTIPEEIAKGDIGKEIKPDLPYTEKPAPSSLIPEIPKPPTPIPLKKEAKEEEKEDRQSKERRVPVRERYLSPQKVYAEELKRLSGKLPPKEAKAAARQKQIDQELFIKNEELKEREERKFDFEERKFEAQLREQERKAKTDKQKLNSREKIEAYKLTEPFRKEVAEKAIAARNRLEDVQRMIELEDEGKLDTPGYVQFLERTGLDFPALLQPGSEEFNKIAANFISDIKSVFGGRITNTELEAFMKTVPSLSQSPEGRKRVIANLSRMYRTAVEQSKVIREIIKDNDGIPPLDLREIAQEKLEPRLNKIARQFKQDLQRKVPEAQDQEVTALQAILGSAAAVPSKVLGALKGFVKAI